MAYGCKVLYGAECRAKRRRVNAQRRRRLDSVRRQRAAEKQRRRRFAAAQRKGSPRVQLPKLQ